LMSSAYVPELGRASSKRHYDAHPDYYRARNARRRQEVRELLIEYKSSRPCVDCGVRYPHYVMEFDHKTGTKSFNIGSATSNRTWGSILREIEKCDLVCANCHSSRTYTRRNILP